VKETDLADLYETLLANFRTIHIPASDPVEIKLGSMFAAVRARRAARRVVQAVQDEIGRALTDRNFHHFHRLEQDLEHGWRLHLFLADDEAVQFLDELAKGAIGPGDTVTFDPDQFLRERLPDCWWAHERR
jgi:hypothetical protein